MADIGGQAVIEGVMMRNQNKIATAVRLSSGKIRIKKQRLKKRSKFLKLFFIRGIVNLYDMLVIGTKTLMWSADQTTEKKEEKLNKFEMITTLVLSFGFAILFFVALPYFLTTIVGIQEESRPIFFNFIDGLIKIALFLGYIYLISLLKDVKILFQYHGAEHKAVYCYENKKPLTVQNTRKYTTLHPRCGTSFLMFVLVISILIFSLLPSLFNWAFPSFSELSFMMRKVILFFSRIMVIPILVGLSYEVLKLSSRVRENIFMKLFIWPGLMFQRLTTQKPTKKQIEVAIAALKAVL